MQNIERRQAASGGKGVIVRVLLCALLAWALLAVPPGQAAEKNLPVPRFVTLRSDQVNVRTGPGERYPIDWVYTHKDMPVEIVAEFENWRKIRDWEGAEGWVHQRMLLGRRAVVIQGKVRELRRKPEPAADVVARVEPGVIAKLVECKEAWCRIEASGVSGWLARADVWGVYPNETVQ